MKDYQIKKHTERIRKQCFIDKVGKIHKYKGDIKNIVGEPSLHCIIATELYPNIKHSKDYLLNIGWVLVGSAVYSGCVVKDAVTQAQINTLYDLGYKKVYVDTGAKYLKEIIL